MSLKKQKQIIVLDDFIEYEDIYTTDKSDSSTTTSDNCIPCCNCVCSSTEIDLWCFKYNAYNAYSIYNDTKIDNYNDNDSDSDNDNVNPTKKANSTTTKTTTKTKSNSTTKSSLYKVSKMNCCACCFECLECKCTLCKCNAVVECCCFTCNCIS